MGGALPRVGTIGVGNGAAHTGVVGSYVGTHQRGKLCGHTPAWAALRAHTSVGSYEGTHRRGQLTHQEGAGGGRGAAREQPLQQPRVGSRNARRRVVHPQRHDVPGAMVVR